MTYENDLIKDFRLSKRKSLNIINNLIGRELGTYSCSLGIVSTFSECSNKKQLTSYNLLKRIYLCVTPSYTVLNVKTPDCYLRKFSPDGRFLIAFSKNLDGVQVFLFNGPSAGIEHIGKFNTKNDKTDFDNDESYTFRMRAFGVYFKEKAYIKLSHNNELMNRECLLFYSNSFLIVASFEKVNDEDLPPYNRIATNNESIHYGLIENYTIYLIDIENSIVCDKLTFKADKLTLAHNQSFGLFNNVFVVLSLQNQTIHVYNLVSVINDNKVSYKFILKQSIGRFCLSDDEEFIHNSNMNLFSSSFSNLTANQSKTNYNRKNLKQRNLNQLPIKGFNETCLTSMKQRILTYFFREAHEKNTINEFYSTINTLLSLKMYKLQLLDDTHILIKYVNYDHMNNLKYMNTLPRGTTSSSLNNRSNNINSNVHLQLLQQLNENSIPFYFVLYNIKTATILNITKNTSTKLLKIFENFHDYFSLATLDDRYSSNDSHFNGNSFNFHTLQSNNIHSRQIVQRHVENISKLSNNLDITKSLLSQLPISPQSFTSTPYLDHNLFSYDEKLISNLERPKPIGDQIVKFSLRDTGRFCFRLYPGNQEYKASQQNNNHYFSMSRLVAFVWHPNQPFCISIQRNPQEYNVNFHVYAKTALN